MEQYLPVIISNFNKVHLALFTTTDGLDVHTNSELAYYQPGTKKTNLILTMAWVKSIFHQP